MWVRGDTEKIGGHPELTGCGGTVRGSFCKYVGLRKINLKKQLPAGKMGIWGLGPLI